MDTRIHISSVVLQVASSVVQWDVARLLIQLSVLSKNGDWEERAWSNDMGPKAHGETGKCVTVFAPDEILYYCTQPTADGAP